MIYKHIHGTALKPSCICLGTAEMGTVMPEAESFQMLDFFLDRGGNFLIPPMCTETWFQVKKA